MEETSSEQKTTSNKVYVGNLPWSVDDGKLKELFSEYGEVEEASVVKEKFSHRSKGFGFVTFKAEDSAKTAVSKMNGKEIEGRALKVDIANPMEARERPPRRDFNRDRGFNKRY